MDRDQREIERLISEIVDDGPTAERVADLNALLIDRPELQEHYGRVVGLHTLMMFEFGATHAGVAPLFPPAADPLAQRDAPSRPVRSISHGGRMASRQRWFVGIAAATAAIAASAILWRQPPEVPPTVNLLDDYAVVGADSPAVTVLSRLTRTALSSISLPAEAGRNAAASLRDGTFWLQPGGGQRERGYVLALPPGAAMSFLVNADAGATNAIAIVELDERGQATGRAISFNNAAEDHAERANYGYSRVADYFEANETQRTKYYLLTGSHIPQAATDGKWRLSDYHVHLRSPEVAFIGWDDSGFTTTKNPASGDYFADKDYNDISAIVQIHTPGQRAIGMRYLPPSEDVVETDALSADACSFRVPAGQSAYVSVAGMGGPLHQAAIVNRTTGRRIWHCDNSTGDMLHRGALLIENGTDEAAEFFVDAKHQTSDAASSTWTRSEHQILTRQPDALVVRFDDGIDNGLGFDDLVVTVQCVPRPDGAGVTLAERNAAPRRATEL